MNKKRFFLFTLLIPGLLLSVSACGNQFSKHGIVSTEELTRMMDQKEDSSNYEMVKLNNGVVVYKDNSASSVPGDYKDMNVNPSASEINFGPREIKFNPGNLHINKKKKKHFGNI